MPPRAVERLIAGAKSGDVEAVRRSLAAGIDVNAHYEDGHTVLYMAAAAGHPAVVEVLLEMGANVHAKNDRGSTAFLPAASGGHLAVVEVLLENGADVDATNNHGLTALILAAAGDHLAVVEVLLEKGADVNAKQENGMTSLLAAVQEGQYDIVEVLLEKGADVDAQCDNGVTALHLAVQEGDLDLVEVLLKKDPVVDVEANGYRGAETPLLMAVLKDPGIVKALLEKGADPNAMSSDGKMPLLKAARWGRLDVVELLVEHGANVNARNINGYTALHCALGQTEVWYSDRTPVAEFLLEHGAVAVIANNDRETPLDYALRPFYDQPDVELICKMLLPSGMLFQLAKDGLEAHEERLKRIKVGLKRAAESRGFLVALADTLAAIDASGGAPAAGAAGQAPDTGQMLVSLLRQLAAFARAAGDGAGAQATYRTPPRWLFGEAYEERRGRHRRAVAAAVRIPAFLSDLAEGLTAANMHVSDQTHGPMECPPLRFEGAPKKLVAAAARLDALSEEGARQPGGAAGAPKRRRRGAA